MSSIKNSCRFPASPSSSACFLRSSFLSRTSNRARSTGQSPFPRRRCLALESSILPLCTPPHSSSLRRLFASSHQHSQSNMSSSSSSPSAFGALEEPLASVLDFWFGKEDVPRFSIWFQGGESVDQDITRRFKALYEDVVAGKFDEQAHNDAFAALAVIVVLDQFSRNMFRNSPLAFAHDDKSLKLALYGIEKGFDKQLTPLQRSFFYLPLEHSEDKAMHEIAVEKFTALADDLKGTPFEKMGPTFLDYELKHKVIIDKFGRYPHRNEVLGRTSTPEELAFLEEDELSQQLSGKRKDK